MFLKISQNSQESTFTRFCIYWSCRPPNYSFLAKETPVQMFYCVLPTFCGICKNTFLKEFFWATTSDSSSTYSRWKRSRYCNKDMKLTSIQAVLVTLCQLWKWFCMLRKLWKSPSRKSYQNLRNLQGKYMWWSFENLKIFQRCIYSSILGL